MSISNFSSHLIFKSNSIEYFSAIEHLYHDAYSKGFSEQYIDKANLEIYISDILKHGNAIFVKDNNIFKACLLYTPLSLDYQCPQQIRSNFNLEKCVYIAEIMVAEPFRGQGFGKLLMKSFFETIEYQYYTDAFIRVWEENLPAIKLYENFDFEKYTSIEQTKTKPDGESDFLMKKIYLHRPLFKE